MQKVTVRSAEVDVKGGNSKRTGKPYSIREQTAYIEMPGKPYPVECKLSLGDQQAPYPPGEYLLEVRAYPGRFGSLELSRDYVMHPQRAATKAA
jgi:hypothetical protein